MIPVKLGDLAREYQEIQGPIDEAIARVLSRGWFILGPEVEAFEAVFADFVGVPYCIGCASGTEAIALALMACDVGPSDEVITVAHTAVPTVTAISMTGARPVFVDIHSETCLMDVAQVEAAITRHTRAIVPVHLYGQCADMEPLLALSQRYGIPIIEDCAQAHGAQYKGRRAGSIGKLGAFSFYPSKNLGCYGDGGAVVTGDSDLAQQLKMLRNYGQRQRYYHETKGLNSRLDEIQAAILGVKINHLDRWNKRRQSIARIYNDGLRELPVTIPTEAKHAEHIYHLYVIQVEQRDALQEYLAQRGVQALVHYPIPVHRQTAYADLGIGPGSLPVTECVAERVLSLPMYPQIGDDEIFAVIESIVRFFA